ncbi:MAG TPA: hypothetical protein VJL59_01275 [Anaerolineales bacterium]|nr:MAG: hypothetical protein A2W37_08795 [Chloroflexi bacterium RBG_16_63_12]HLB45633.1 hypothetical protein [Anaerolineales bacterium]
MAQGLTDLSSALAMRLRDIARLLDRLDRLESGTGEWLASQGEGALQEAATDMTLRALRAAADPTNFAILAFLSAHTSAPIAELEAATGFGRLALAERVNDLVQVGLAGRNIDTDHVQGTAAGAALVGLIHNIGEATAKRLAEVLQPVTR